MLEVFRQKIIRLVRGDDGVALVVTLALFMMLYISCAGVFAVGRSVKERIILQNAADAAAYSAAVVEADILSRIATINRAMAWKYKDLVNRQMDLVAYRFLNTSLELDHYEGDRLKSKNESMISAEDAGSPGFLTIHLKGTGVDVSRRVSDIKNLLDSMSEQSLEDEVNSSSKAIGDMVEEIKNLLYVSMGSEIDERVRMVVLANLPPVLGDRCQYIVSAPNPDDILAPLSGDESRFLSFANETTEGFREWLPEKGSGGFRHLYDKSLVSDWYYMPKGLLSNWQHDDFVYEQVEADFELELAVPYVLKDAYFPGNTGSQGAISVAIAKRNENPWKDLFASEGMNVLHSVFNYVTGNNWTFAVASAQAGYRKRSQSEKVEGRQYLLKYDADPNGDWNLSTDDWDALYIPVRKAFGENGAAFSAWLQDPGGWKLVCDADSLVKNEVPFLTDQPNAVQLPRMHSGSDDGRLKWNDNAFLDLMYH